LHCIRTEAALVPRCEGWRKKPSRGWMKKLQNCNRFPWFCRIWWPAAKVTIVPIAPYWTTCPAST
ncbi:uncharacterized protein METZ01_LOCUS314196, partial [marine metagenome]